jgi:hypothetical protein
MSVSKRPQGVIARRNQHRVVIYSLKGHNEKEVVVGTDRDLALQMWAREREAQVQLGPPTTALELLESFSRCSLPLPDQHATRIRRAEMATLAAYFRRECDPCLNAIQHEMSFLQWHEQRRHACAPDAAVRLFRLVWRFAMRLEIVQHDCPWKSLDLRQSRLQMEVIEVLYNCATTPLKELLGDILRQTKASTTTNTLDEFQCTKPGDLPQALAIASKDAVERLRSCGRVDLIPAVHQLTVERLFQLSTSPHTKFCVPPGRIDLGHRRKEALTALKVLKRSVDIPSAANVSRSRRELDTQHVLPEGNEFARLAKPLSRHSRSEKP